VAAMNPNPKMELERLVDLFSKEELLDAALSKHPTEYASFFTESVGYPINGKQP
jgi:hypothetical protein